MQGVLSGKEGSNTKVYTFLEDMDHLKASNSALRYYVRRNYEALVQAQD